jgi:hypothetical protein
MKTLKGLLHPKIAAFSLMAPLIFSLVACGPGFKATLEDVKKAAPVPTLDHDMSVPVPATESAPAPVPTKSETSPEKPQTATATPPEPTVTTPAVTSTTPTSEATPAAAPSKADPAPAATASAAAPSTETPKTGEMSAAAATDSSPATESQSAAATPVSPAPEAPKAQLILANPDDAFLNPKSLPKSQLSSSANLNRACPLTYTEPLKTLEDKGLKGWWNGGLVLSAFSQLKDGKAVHPRTTCESKASPLKSLKTDLKTTIQATASELNLDATVLSTVAANCDSRLSGMSQDAADLNWIRSFAVLQMGKRWASLENEIEDLLELHQHYQMITSASANQTIRCENFATTSLRAFCQSLPACSSPQQRAQAFQAKFDILSKVVQALQELKSKKADPKLAEPLKALSSSPILQTEEIKSYIQNLGNRPAVLADLQRAYLKDIETEKKALRSRINTLSSALNCHLGLQNQNCEAAEKEIESLKLDARSKVQPELRAHMPDSEIAVSRLDNFHTCYHDNTQSLKGFNSEINTLVTAPLLMIAPGGVFTTLRALQVGYRVATIALRTSNIAALGGLTYQGLNHAYQRCNSLSDEASAQSRLLRNDLISRQKALTCEGASEKFAIAETARYCELEYALAVIPGGLMGREVLLLRQQLLQNIVSRSLVTTGRTALATRGASATDSGAPKIGFTPEMAAGVFTRAENAASAAEIGAEDLLKSSPRDVADIIKTLELPADANPEMIKASLRQLLRKYHPQYYRGSDPQQVEYLTAVTRKLTDMLNILKTASRNANAAG